MHPSLRLCWKDLYEHHVLPAKTSSLNTQRWAALHKKLKEYDEAATKSGRRVPDEHECKNLSFALVTAHGRVRPPAAKQQPKQQKTNMRSLRSGNSAAAAAQNAYRDYVNEQSIPDELLERMFPVCQVCKLACKLAWMQTCSASPCAPSCSPLQSRC